MKLHAFLLFVHLVSVVVWVGGMFFAHVCLRPAAQAALNGPERLALWREIFPRFFRWVAVAIIGILLSGGGMLARSGFVSVPPVWHAMMGLGLVMAAIYVSILAGPYRRFRESMSLQDLPAAAAAQIHIRQRVLINLVLGLGVVGLATWGAAF